MRKQSLCLFVVTVVAVGCGSDHIVSAGGDLISRRIDASRGDLIDIRLWGGALGTYASPPVISTAVVEFVDLDVETGSGGIVNPGGPTQRFRFRALTPGSAVVTFSPLQQGSPVVSDTIVVH
jgi:hypothetical protein